MCALPDGERVKGVGGAGVGEALVAGGRLEPQGRVLGRGGGGEGGREGKEMRSEKVEWN